MRKKGADLFLKNESVFFVVRQIAAICDKAGSATTDQSIIKLLRSLTQPSARMGKDGCH